MVFNYWRDGKIEEAPETWQHFHDRIDSVLTEIAQGSGPALVVTSGGLISMAMSQAAATRLRQPQQQQVAERWCLPRMPQTRVLRSYNSASNDLRTMPACATST